MSKAKKDTIKIEPEIRVGGEKHLLEKLFEEGKLPDLTLVGTVNLDSNRLHQWISLTVKTKGDRIVSIESVSEPDMKPHAVDGARTKFVTHFMDQVE